jgi:hypothetical protein
MFGEKYIHNQCDFLRYSTSCSHSVKTALPVGTVSMSISSGNLHHVKNVSHLILPLRLLANERSFASLILPPKDARLPSSGRRGAYTP